MPKEKEVTNHPCHLLSLPSAKRFWCRHCMTVFEDAITRWRHSRSCRYGVVNNFMRRRELEAKALQNTTVLNPVEARLEQSIQMCDLAASNIPPEQDPNIQPQIMSGPESFTCFICHQKFASMEEMRAHVKDPCSNSKIITSRVPHPKHSVPVFIDALPGRVRSWQSAPSAQQPQDEIYQSTALGQVHNQHQQHTTQSDYDIESQSQSNVEPQYDSGSMNYENSSNTTSDNITPTNIYVNEQGETVIEVENLDLNTEGGELSLAHLLTQLSQQGIVFDKTGSAHLQAKPEVPVSGASPSTTLYATHPGYDQSSSETFKIKDEEEQPTAEDAANTLAQLAGFRGFTRLSQKQDEGNHQVQTQVQAVEGHNYHTTSAGPSRQYTVNAQPQTDINYQFQYSDSPSETSNPLVTSQQMALQQAMSTTTQDYENVKVESEATGEPVQFYNECSYVTGNSDHQQMHVDPEANIITEECKSEAVGDEDSQSVMVQHYSVNVDETGQLINVPVEISGQVVTETTGTLISTEHVGVEGAPMTINPNEHDPHQQTLDPREAGQSSNNDVQAEGIVSGDLAPDTEANAENDEFTIQTVSLQEIVDSDTTGLSFESQTQTGRDVGTNIIDSNMARSGDAEVTTVTLDGTHQPENELIQASVAQHEGEMQSLVAGAQQSLASQGTTLFVVSSTGIVPVSSENA